MADHTINVNIIDRSVPIGNHVNIAVVNKPNPVYNEAVDASTLWYLINIPNYFITDANTSAPINGSNYYEYFPEEGGGGGGGGTVTIDTQVVPNSPNPVQNRAIYSFVNSSVATNTANFVGTYDSLADLKTHSDYPYDITNNDYGFVVGSDSSGNTEYERYKYNSESTDWQFEYTLNNSSFTAAEWATIQSGFTAADKTKYDGYEAIINSKPGLIESSGGEIFNTYSGDVKNSAYDRAHAEGFNTTASGFASHSEGVGTKATGDQSHAEGKNTTASGYVSHTEGENTKATNWYAHAEGYNTTAEGRGSHAEGSNTKATNVFSHAEGLGTTASGENSHAEGTGTTASGVGSHAEGTGTTASNSHSHAEGQASKALGLCSHAEGNNTTAKGQSQHAEGEYNVVDESVSSSNPRGKFAHIIGNGTADDARSNAYAIGWDGKIYQPSDPNSDSNGVFLSSKANKATTLEGYGITDAKFTPSTGTIQLGSNTLVPVRTIQINGTVQTNTNGTVNIPVASTSAYGATILSDSVSSTDTTKAATSNAVKTAYDEGVTALEYSANTGVKNLFKPTIEDIIPITSGGFQLIVNEDGSITTSGTISAEDWLLLGRFIPEKTGYYLFSSGISQTDYTNKPYLYTTVNGESVHATLTGTRVLLEAGVVYDIMLDIKANYTNNETYYPMIRSCDVTDYTYQPYAMSNVNLTREVSAVVNDGVKNLVRYNLTVPPELKAVVNVDGSITVTASSTTAVRRLTIATDLSGLVDGKTYILSGCSGGNAVTTYHLGITKSNYAGLIYQISKEIVFQKTSEMALLVLTVRADQSWTKTFYPMIREATITDEKFRAYALPNPELTACELSDINNGGVNLFDIYRWDTTSNIVITDKGDEKINLACNGSSSAFIKYYIPKLIPKIVYRVTLFVDSLTVTSGNNPIIQAYSQNNSGGYDDASFSIIDSTTISSTGVYTWDVTVSDKTYPGIEILINMAKNAATTNNMDFHLMVCERSYALADPTYKMYSESNAALTQMTTPQFRRGPLTDSMLPNTTSVIFGKNASVAGVSDEYVVVRTYCYNYDSKSESVLAIQIAEFDTGVRKTRKRIGSSWGSWV